MDLFEKTAEACGWARSQWPVRLIPLLTGEVQVAAQQLPGSGHPAGGGPSGGVPRGRRAPA